MIWIVGIAVVMLLVMAGAQFVGVWQLTRHVAASRKANDRLSEQILGSTQPRVAILLSLRGADPDLLDGLLALGRQDYANYQLSVVVDHERDPALTVARQAQSQLPAGRMQVDVIRNRSTSCGLKCSALAQAFRDLDSNVEVIALVDADIVVNQDWLRLLVAPLADPNVGVATGAQWFEPQDNDSGTWLRSIWNAGASVPTILLGHPWAGSCAMRRSDMIQTELVERWERSIIDDGPIAQVAAEMKREVRFVPSAWMINREHCSRKFVGTYLTRMLTWSRLYESTYSVTVGHAVGTIVLWSIAWLCMLQGLINAEPWRIWLGLIPAVAFWLAATIGYWLVRSVMKREASARGESLARRGIGEFIKVLWLVPTTYLVYAWSSVAALRVKRVIWRGVEYRLESGKVRMTHYEPFRAAPPGTRSSVDTPKIQKVREPLSKLGIAALLLGLGVQITLLLKCSWVPQYAAVITPTRTLAQFTSLPGEAVGFSSIATSHDNPESPGQTNGSAAIPDLTPVQEHRPATSPETWSSVDEFAKATDRMLVRVQDVTGILVKQERIGGKLESLATLEFRQLTSPLCIHLRWTETHAGREVLFRVEEDESETMIARQETFFGALVPTVSLSKDHPFTRTVSPHPIDELSTVYLRKQIKRYLAGARRNPQALVELEQECQVGDRLLTRLTIVHPERTELAPGGYHRVDMYFDHESGFPVRWEKYHWPDWRGADEYDPEHPSATLPLLEYFELRSWSVNEGLTFEDFSNDNPEFGFGKAPIVPFQWE